MNKIFILLILFALSISILPAWIRSYERVDEGPSFYSVCEMEDGNLLFFGTYWHGESFYPLLMITDEYGDTELLAIHDSIWGLLYDGLILPDGNVVACGQSCNADDSCIATLWKFNIEGEKLWSRRYIVVGNGEFWSYARDLYYVEDAIYFFVHESSIYWEPPASVGIFKVDIDGSIIDTSIRIYDFPKQL